ncbi:MAG: hypothetical protein K2Q01_01825 [Rickettsiales bacterium]|nr:hypothetical protein [Rickettsiales bacterium]
MTMDKAAKPTKLKVEVGETGYKNHPVLLVLLGDSEVLDGKVNEMAMARSGADKDLQILPNGGEENEARFPLAFKTADAAKAFLTDLRREGIKTESAAPKMTIDDALKQLVADLAKGKQ